MSKVKNAEEPSAVMSGPTQQTGNSIIISGNANDFRPAVQSNGNNTGS